MIIYSNTVCSSTDLENGKSSVWTQSKGWRYIPILHTTEHDDTLLVCNVSVCTLGHIQQIK